MSEENEENKRNFWIPIKLGSNGDNWISWKNLILDQLAYRNLIEENGNPSESLKSKIIIKNNLQVELLNDLRCVEDTVKEIWAYLIRNFEDNNQVKQLEKLMSVITYQYNEEETFLKNEVRIRRNLKELLSCPGYFTISSK